MGDLYDEVADEYLGVRPPKKRGTLAQTDLEDTLRRAGWDEKHVPIMSAIGMAESSGRSDAYNPGVGHGGRPTKEKSVGLWQVNTLAHPQYDKEKLKDPDYNAKAALDIFKKQGLKAWGAYTDGRYKRHYKATPNVNPYDAVADEYLSQENHLLPLSNPPSRPLLP